MQHFRRVASIFSLATVAVAGLLTAQDPGSIYLRAYGGGLKSVTKMNGLGVFDTKMGTGFGGGLGYQASDVFTVRADGYFTKSTISNFGAELADKMDRTYASLIAQFQLPEGTILPYLLTGLGATFVNQRTTVDPKKTYGHWVGGAGVEFGLGGSGLSFVAEARMHVYNAVGLIGNAYSDSRVMSDAALTGGFAYRLR